MVRIGAVPWDAIFCGWVVPPGRSHHAEGMPLPIRPFIIILPFLLLLLLEMLLLVGAHVKGVCQPRRLLHWVVVALNRTRALIILNLIRV